MIPRNIKQKVAVGIVSGLGRIDKFHFNTISYPWLKVDAKEVMSYNAAFMYLYKAADQNLGKNVVDNNAL
jgi:hypothetical protein